MENSKKVDMENKKNVTGGEVYAGPDANGRMVYYVPHPNPRTHKSLSYTDRQQAINEANRLGQDTSVIDCQTADAARQSSDAKLGELMRGSGQSQITSFFKPGH